MATKFFATAYNLPWIKIPVCFLENNVIHIVYDPINTPKTTGASVVFIKRPNTFVKQLPSTSSYVSFFDSTGATDTSVYEFECNSTVAEELISLAISFALENVES